MILSPYFDLISLFFLLTLANAQLFSCSVAWLKLSTNFARFLASSKKERQYRRPKIAQVLSRIKPHAVSYKRLSGLFNLIIVDRIKEFQALLHKKLSENSMSSSTVIKTEILNFTCFTDPLN